MDTFSIFVILAIIISASVYWGSFLSLHLPELFSALDRKPFNCRPCLSFHIMWCLSAVCALVLTCELVFYIGFILSFAVFFVLKYIDNKMIIK